MPSPSATLHPIRALTHIARSLVSANTVRDIARIAVDGVITLGLGRGAVCSLSDVTQSEQSIDEYRGLDRTLLETLGSSSPMERDRWAKIQQADPTALLISLYVDERAVGYLAAFDRPDGEPIDRWVITSLGDNVSVALGQLRLEQEANRAEERAEALQEAIDDSLTALAAVSHDARSPLQSIKMSVHRLRDGDLGPVTDDQLRALERISRSLDYINEMMTRFMDAAAIVGGDIHLYPASIRVRPVLSEAASFCAVKAEKAGLRVDLDVDAQLRVFSDGLRLRQIAVNLIDNAVKYAAPGPLRIRARQSSEGRVEVAFTDEGPGIADHDRARIFDIFRRGEPASRAPKSAKGGVGLGLGISRELAQALGGELSLAADGPPGASFLLRLPTEERGVETADEG